MEWKGRYRFEAANKDGLSTVFDIRIHDLDNIAVIHAGDGGTPETYRHLKAEIEASNTIRIDFNPAYGEMGRIFLERNGSEILISGQPIYYINPGNNARAIRKLE